MRKLSILTGALRGSKLNEVGTAGLRRWISVVISRETEKVCKKVVSNLPAVLLLANGDPRPFSRWNGDRIILKTWSDPAMLPFVDRIDTVTELTLAIFDNFEQAERLRGGNDAVERSLRLIGSGASFGAGKTRIGYVLYLCLTEKLAELGKNKRVVHVLSKIGDKKNPYRMWRTDVCPKPGMEGLAAVINNDMFIEELVQATERYLFEHDMIMFLHLDEFAPFDDSGRTNNTPEDFYQCWQRMLMPILCSPSIGLFISGRMPYFDTIGSGQSGQSPSFVLSVQLDLFTKEIIHTILEKTFVPLNNVTAEETISLSTALDRLSPPQGSWSHDVAERLHDVTGGVPRFVEHALHALLMNRDIYSSLFACVGMVHRAALLDEMYSKGGGVYDAVSKAAVVHIRNVGAACEREEDRVKMLAGLLQLLFLRDRSFVLSKNALDILSSALLPSDETPISQLVSYAQFWGIHRAIDRHGGRISFPVPNAMVDGLATALAGWKNLLPDLKDESKKEKDLLGEQAELKVRASLTFHRLMAALLPHTNWLGDVEDLDGPVSLAQDPTATATTETATHTPTSYLLQLPRLPIINPNGKMPDVEALRRSITHGDGIVKEDDKSMCRPELLGKYLKTLSSTEFHAFRTGPRSSSADFFVRYGNDVTHLQVRNVNVPVNFRKVLEECGKAAPTVEASSELQHTLVFVIEDSGVRTATTKMIGPLSVVDLVKELKNELKKVEVADGKKKSRKDRKIKGDEYKHQRMDQAIDLVSEGKLKVEVLDDIQYMRFMRFRELAKYLVGGVPQ